MKKSSRRRRILLLRLTLAVASLACATVQASARPISRDQRRQPAQEARAGQPRSDVQAEAQKSARERRQEANERLNAWLTGQPAPAPSTTASALQTFGAAFSVQPPIGIGISRYVDVNLPNYANSPNLRKFVDSLPGLAINPPPGDPSVNQLGQYIPVAVPDTTSYPGSDYYEIGLVEYFEQMHSDLPPTKLRGYVQLNGGDPNPHYLGPVIVAQKDRPVRIKFTNMLPTGAGGDLFLPVDPTIMGAGMGPLGMNVTAGNPMDYTQNRATLHLHGGRSPWISDGTPHQWTVPAGEKTDYPKGLSVANVPDMPAPGPGSLTFYWTNGQSARLMFYHDHAYGITRLNVYAGEAAGYLITDSTEQSLISSGVLPGLGVPLVIQDRTFVNDASTSASTSANLPPGYAPTPLTDTVDPLWKSYVPGGIVGGDLWNPHEYMTNENPFDPRGYNDMGRWDYAPWMLPPMPILNTELPSPTIVPETFQDTMIVNGTAFPYIELPPTAVRFRILNACNDRMLNLQLYKAEPLTVTLVNGGAGYVSPVVSFSGGGASVPGAANATVDLATGAIVGITVTAPGVGYSSAPTVNITDSGGPGIGAVAFASAGTEVKMVPALYNPVYPTWPQDGRPGGVPDPTTMGPNWYQIGNEGGFLAQVAAVPPQPVDFDYNRRSVTFGGVTSKSLYLPPAVRADVVVDLSSYQDGDTVILYNDAPAPMPLYDTRYDYFTDDPDQTTIGGAPATAPGFGPNTRTVMQIRIRGAATAPYNLAALQAALPAAFAAGQAPILVPNSAYNAAYGAFYPDIYANALDETLNLTGTTQPVAQVKVIMPGQGYITPPTVNFYGGGGSGASATATLNGVTGITVVTGGSGYSANPTVAMTPAPGGTGTGATATAIVSGGVITSITLVNPGSNYLVAPTVTITDLTGAGATATATITLGSVGAINLISGGTGYTKAPYAYLTGGGGTGAQADAMLVGASVMDGKNLTEGFDMEFGRMNAVLGSTPNPLTPTVGAGPVVGAAFYVDPPTEILTPEQPLLWRLSHIGVDSHAIHFHLFDVQVVNRVDWTGIVKPPYPEEVGWKETVRTNPFEDLIVALRPTTAAMKLPFGLPNSNRLLDVTMPAGSTMNFTPVPPPPGLPAAGQLTNVMTNFRWEYVWHCHLLGHEENDMMRPIVLNAVSVLPTKSVITYTRNSSQVNLTWTDGTPFDYTIGQPASTLGNPANEIGFVIQRATIGTNNQPGAYAQIGTALANRTTFTDTTVVAATSYSYIVTAYNAAGNSASAAVLVGPVVAAPPAAPTSLTAVLQAGPRILVTFIDNATSESGFVLERSVNGGAFATYATLPARAGSGNAVSYADTAVSPGTTYAYRAYAVNSAGASAYSNSAGASVPALPAAPSSLTGTAALQGTKSARATLTWTDNSTNETGFTLQWATNSSFTTGLGTATAPANTTTLQTSNLLRRTTYWFRVQAFNIAGASAWANGFSLTTP